MNEVKKSFLFPLLSLCRSRENVSKDSADERIIDPKTWLAEEKNVDSKTRSGGERFVPSFGYQSLDHFSRDLNRLRRGNRTKCRPVGSHSAFIRISHTQYTVGLHKSMHKMGLMICPFTKYIIFKFNEEV